MRGDDHVNQRGEVEKAKAKNFNGLPNPLVVAIGRWRRFQVNDNYVDVAWQGAAHKNEQHGGCTEKEEKEKAIKENKRNVS